MVASSLVTVLGATGPLAVVVGAAEDESAFVRRRVVGQLPAPLPSSLFRYDETSGKCLDGEGREGYNRISREELTRTQVAECADFSGGMNLTYLRLTGANLRGAHFTGVAWYLGSITDSDLSGANLSGTHGQMDYQRSRLRGARLTGADLTYTELGDADLTDADLGGATFSRHTTLPFDHAEGLRRGMIFIPKP